MYIDRAKFHSVFCADVSESEARTVAAVQKPLNGAVFGQSVPVAAWHTIPSWYVVGQEDNAIAPDQERFYARRMAAHTTELKCSHVSYVAHPKEITQIIEEAAKSVTP